MKNKKEVMLISGSSHDLGGGFTVRRLLPFRKKRMVGPFIFLDHMGPFEFIPSSQSDIRPHPHIGLSTLTYLYEGRMVHRDSLGNVQTILPGEVNWMTAGEGIVHSERAHVDDHHHKIKMEGLQFWVALPDTTESSNPTFVHYEKSKVPLYKGKGFKANIVAGKAFNLLSPVKVSSPLIFINIVADENSEFDFNPEKENFEIAIYVLEGDATLGETKILAGTIGVLFDGNNINIKMSKGSRLVIIGGEPFKTQRLIYWNFVASTREKIEEAKTRWKEERFPLIPGDDKERIPLGD